MVQAAAQRSAGAAHHAVVVVGAGFAGLAVAIALRRRGVEDLVVLERAEALGGAWRDNTYPGCACDVPSHLYSFSFAPKADWSSVYAPQEEIRRYLEEVAERLDVRRHVRFGREVVRAAWDEARARWALELRDGEALTADALVVARGALSQPSVPDLPGRERFRGIQMHSARWDRGVDLRGKRVAVVGTGASAIQIVPRLQPEAGRLVVVQRTPPWILPRRDRRYTAREKAALRRVPGLRRAYRAAIFWRLEARVLAFAKQPAVMKLVEREARGHLARSVADPALRAALTPAYDLGCKRILLSDDYYPALAQPNVEVVADPIAEVLEGGLRFASGREEPLDALVWATGFDVHDYLGGLEVRGRGGESLGERWRRGGAEAYLGTTVHGFPNLFVMTGPNTGLGHSSMVAIIEGQAGLVGQAVDLLRRRGAASLEPRAEVQDAFNAWLREQGRDTVWSSGCRSWYLDAEGRNTTLWPSFVTSFRARTARLRERDYLLRPPAAAPHTPRSPPMTQRAPLDGKAVLVTGAARGIGAETARRLARAGARVALVGLEPERLEALAAELGPGHAWLPCDVTDQAALERAVAGAVAALGGLDAVIANAGIANNGPVAVNTADALVRTVEVNLGGVIRTASATLPHLAARRGYLLLVSSAAALLPTPGLAAYAASKIGVEHFGAALRLEVAHRGVAVGVAHPSWIDTDLVRDQQADLAAFRALLARLPGPLGRTTSVEACADAFVDAVVHRRRKVYVPRSIALIAAARGLLGSALAERVVTRATRRILPDLEREVASLGRDFGRSSAGFARKA